MKKTTFSWEKLADIILGISLAFIFIMFGIATSSLLIVLPIKENLELSLNWWLFIVPIAIIPIGCGIGILVGKFSKKPIANTIMRITGITMSFYIIAIYFIDTRGFTTSFSHSIADIPELLIFVLGLNYAIVGNKKLKRPHA